MHELRWICSEIDLESSRYEGYSRGTYLGNPRYGDTHKETYLGKPRYVGYAREVYLGCSGDVRYARVTCLGHPRYARYAQETYLVCPCIFIAISWFFPRGRKKIKASGGERNNFPQSIRG